MVYLNIRVFELFQTKPNWSPKAMMGICNLVVLTLAIGVRLRANDPVPAPQVEATLAE